MKLKLLAATAFTALCLFGQTDSTDGDGGPAPVPEPATFVMLGLGLAAVGYGAWRRNRKQ